MLLAFELKLVWEMLPAASAADAEMFAVRFNANIGWFYHPVNVTFCIIFLLSVYFYVGYVSRSSVRDEYDHVVDACKSIAFGSDICDFNIIYKRQIFFSFGHGCVS